MPLKVIGAGFGRTGTMSLKLALERLGFGPCYHMAEVIQIPTAVADWTSVFDGAPRTGSESSPATTPPWIGQARPSGVN